MSAPTSPLYLSPNQRNLLVAALASNQPTDETASQASSAQDKHNMSNQTSAPNSSRIEFDESPYIDYPLDGDEESFNFDEEGQMFGDLPEDSPDNGTADPDHLHDKRKSLSTQDQDDEGGGKRREGDKQAKKPGRKPLTSEPTNKRKAQNRAAQRAFRERKEQHLKDLETKVEEMERDSQATNQENSELRAQVERLNVELKEYRKRLSWVSSNPSARPSGVAQSRNSMTGSGSSDFQFQFPKFGDSPHSNNLNGVTSQRASQHAPVQRSSSISTNQTNSPATSSAGRKSMSQAFQNSRQNSNGNSPRHNLTNSPPTYNQNQTINSVDSLSGLFSPGILEAARNSPQGYFGIDNTASNFNANNFNNSYSSVPGLYSGSSVSNTESPGSSSDVQNHLSSIGTSPENYNSPNHKLQDLGLNTINEENSYGGQWNFNTNKGTDIDVGGFSWLAQQNGGAFDPLLFGDYRETTDNVLSQDFGSFFNDAYPLPDLGSPSHNYGDTNTRLDQLEQPDLLARVEAAKESDSTSKLVDAPKLMTCNKIWDRLQSMEKFRNGEIDIDNLCSELRAKAKCSEGGAVVEEKHVNQILGL